MNSLIYHLRLQQWYKNLLIFLPLMFSGNLLNGNAFFFTLLGFALLCILSSGNYFLNDAFDWKRDKHHKDREQYFGRFTLSCFGIFFVMLALVISFYFLPFVFSMILVALFFISTLYSAFLKHIAFADILSISVNFVLRAISGAYIFVIAGQSYIWISPWLIICTFFLALFLATGKRYAEFQHQSKKFRPVLQWYTIEVSHALLIMTTACLVMSYTLYSFLGEAKMMIITLPFALFTIFRYLALIYQKNDIAEKPYKVVHDVHMVAGIVLWIMISLIILYGF